MKNIKALLGSLAIAAILGANGYMAMSGTKAQSELTLEGVERVAQGIEWSDVMPGRNWYSHKYRFHCVGNMEETTYSGVGKGARQCSSSSSSYDKYYDVIRCETGPGNCWWSDDEKDCAELIHKRG